MDMQQHATHIITDASSAITEPVRSELASAVLFRVVQCALLPIGGVGYVSFVAGSLAASRRLGASTTLLASFYTRWMQDALGVRRDEACAKLMAVMPTVPPISLRLVTAPTRWAHRLTGYVPPIYRYPYRGEPPFAHQPAARTTYYDQTLQRHLAGVDQLVVLGAGFDTRSYTLVTDRRIRCFEVDAPNNSALKRLVLERAGVDTRHVTFVAADFAHEDWFEKLVASGFKQDAPTLFTWESVSMYLDQPAVESTLRKISQSAPGSVLAFDYFSAQLLAAPLMRWARMLMSAIGEPWKFGVDARQPAEERLSEFLERCGLALVEQRNFGHETRHLGAPAGFATAVVTSDAVA